MYWRTASLSQACTTDREALETTIPQLVFPSENEATAAANIHFQQIERQADGWESEWRRLLGDGILQLYGRIEEGEKDSETYKVSVKRVQQKRPVAVQPRVPSLAQPKSRVVKPTHVYMVKEERTIRWQQ